jgi:hypothetical protein
VFAFFGVDDRESMSAADDRAGVIQQAAVVEQERAAFISGMFGHMTAYCIGLRIGKFLQGRPHGRRFDGEHRY